MKASLFHVTVILAVVLAGCERDCYVIEITPDGEGFQRKLTCWHEKAGDSPEISALSKDRLDRIEELYGSRQTPEEAKKHVFAGRFTARTPADVGGAGSYTQLATPLGTAWAYVERFRGNDDLEAELARRRVAANQLTDLLLGWAEAELGSDPSFDRLRKFLDEDLRRDLKNLGLYLWSGDVASRYRPDSQEFIVRIGQYLYERGYLARNDLPALGRAALANDSARLLAVIQRLVARKMGVPDDQPIPESLSLLSDLTRLKTSWDNYLPTTDLFKSRLKQWEDEKKTNPEAEQPTPDDVVGQLFADALFKFELAPGHDRLEVKLPCGVEPFSTNGRWDETLGAVTWEDNLGEHPSLPTLCFALWSRPDQEVQRKHFGKLVLAGSDLGKYAIWYKGLNPDEAGQWDGFIAGCKPDGDLKAALEAFRFTGDPQPDPDNPEDKPSGLADVPRQLILSALEKDGESNR